ncbi:MAG: 1-deoxy-D-xylulose-5-phosphate reductoisomerase [Bdellovibrionales bacterium]|nr:1-deoxy-D-xylulose-5-phosphate reductoisomerase [Bdellovibrionales bacterium]
MTDRSTLRLAIYGSTGSIGISALDVVGRSESLSATALFAHSNVERFVEQVLLHQPRFAGLVDAKCHQKAIDVCGGRFQGKWLSGDEITAFATSSEYDVQVAAVIGVEGLRTTFPAFCAGKSIALANKESLVVGGKYFCTSGDVATRILPLDSEHSSLYRLLSAVRRENVSRLILTASGGPFLGYSEEQLQGVTVADALNHPTWSMGPRISLDSATMVNKGFEIIEAHWLFDWPSDQIGVVIHPQSKVHGIIQLCDGTRMYHESPPDMRSPISFALHSIGNRGEKSTHSFHSGAFEVQPTQLEFFPCSPADYPAIRVAQTALQEGFGYALRFYVANEVVCQRFLEGRFPFTGILRFICFALEQFPLSSEVRYEEIFELISEERAIVRRMLDSYRFN